MVTIEKELITFCYEINKNENTSFYSDALQQHFGKAQVIDFLEIKSSKKEIKCSHTGRISTANPAFNHFLSQTSDTNSNWQSDSVSKAAVSCLGIDLKQVERIKMIQTNSCKLCLVVQNVDWKSLSMNQLKFAFLYLSLLKETDQRINNLKIQLNKLDNTEKVMYWVSEMQITWLNEAMDMLKTQSNEIPQIAGFIKKDYSLKDFEALTLYFLNNCISNFKRKFGHHFTEEVNQYLRNYYISVDEVKSRIQSFRRELQSLEDEALKQILQKQIEMLLSFYNGEYVSLHEYSYAKSLLIEISELFTKNNDNKVEIEQIENLLITFNFNQTEFIDWKTKRIRDEMKQYKNQHELRKYLLLEQKKIKQLVVNSGIAYRKRFPSASELVITWIKEELAYMEGLSFSNPEEISYSLNQDGVANKITTTLNVPQLALFAALMVEEDLIQDKNKTQVFSTFAKVFKTVNQPNIAVTSLRNNYYDKDPKNLEALKTKLIQMINRLNQNLNSNEPF